MRKFIGLAVGSAVAFVGFAGAANASATVDLIWIDKTDATCTDDGRRDCPRLGATLSNVSLGDDITLAVMLTAGRNGSWGAGVSVDYGGMVLGYPVTGFRSLTTKLPKAWLPSKIGTTTNQSPFIDNINAAAAPTVGLGIGLPSAGSAYLGTVTFHKDQMVNGTFEIAVGTDGPGGTDDVLDGSGRTITATTALNSAYIVNISVHPTPTPSPVVTPTAAPTATPTAPPIPCSTTWPSESIVTIGKSNSPTNNQKVSHRITGNIIDPGALCPDAGECTAQRIPVCAGTGVTIAVTGSTDNTNIGKGNISCDAPGCSVGAVNVTEKYRSVSADGKDTDRMTLLPQ